MPVYFGDKIRTARKAAKLTQRELADKIGVSNTSISNWEKNLSRPDPDIIQNLCWILGVSPNYFFDEETKNTPISKDERKFNGDDILFALSRGGEAEITDAMFEEVKRFAAYVGQRDGNKK